VTKRRNRFNGSAQRWDITGLDERLAALLPEWRSTEQSAGTFTILMIGRNTDLMLSAVTTLYEMLATALPDVLVAFPQNHSMAAVCRRVSSQLSKSMLLMISAVTLSKTARTTSRMQMMP